MNDFHFLHNAISGKWVISAPRRAKRPDISHGTEPVCPFCPGREGEEKELYRIQKSEYQNSNLGNNSDWLVRVIPNKFPFAPIHELVIHSPDHHKNFDELPVEHVAAILRVYKHRYNEHSHSGQVIIFHNRAQQAGESLPHPHTQIAVIPEKVTIDAPRLGSVYPQEPEYLFETDQFVLISPKTSQWPDEVWIAPKKQGRVFGEIIEREIADLALVLKHLILIFDHRHGHEFPFNFFIYSGGDWYLRLIPRVKSIGGFELATGIFVNTQLPLETMAFIREYIKEPNIQKILTQHQAEYHRSV